MMSDLPRDLAEDVLSRLPATSLRAMRFACKNWNTLSKGRRFRERHVAEIKAASESMVVTRIGYKLYLRSINLHGIDKGLEPSINYQGKLFNLTDEVEIVKVCHCDGLLLCVLRDYTRMVVWNPYLGQTRWFKSLSYVRETPYRYAIGYDQSSSSSSSSCDRNYKILRYYDSSPDHFRYEVYYLNKCRDDTIPVTFLSDWDVEPYARGTYQLSLMFQV